MTTDCRAYRNRDRPAAHAAFLRAPAGLAQLLLLLLACAVLMGGVLATSAGADEVDDALVYDRVIRSLVNDRELKTNNLTVSVQDGVVVVRGEVTTEKLRTRVTRVVKKAKGVKKVVNEVTVRR